MSEAMDLTRRKLLKTSLGGACSLAAHPMITPVAFASAPTDQRLVVLILRGGMDGLSVLEPYGDRHLEKLRPRLARRQGEGLHDLDGFFGLDPRLAPLMPLWRAGELAFASAVSTPYRNKRSHFDGQDALEFGSGSRDGEATSGRDGWLNRLLSHLPDSRRETAMVVGNASMLILEGANPTTTWSPRTQLSFDNANRDLLEVMYAGDPLFQDALEGAVTIASKSRGASHYHGQREIAGYAAQRLADDSRIVTFSIGGWDTHRAQSHRISGPLTALRETILTFKTALGPVWAKTTIVAMTEFGRTVRENGSGGTDHGTGGALLMAGGALNGGRIYGKWPGLGPRDLYHDRDLMPTEDIRSYCAWLLRSKFGVTRAALERDVFPGLDLAEDPRLLG
ncbi:MAG: DUF1501 domain-containing protein [Pseudomonadota bacterium]